MTAQTNNLNQAPPQKRKPAGGRVSPQLVEAGRMEAADALRKLESGPDGLTESVAEERLAQSGPNEVSTEKRHNWATRFFHAVRNPLVILLTVLAIISFSTAQETSDFVGAWLMVPMVLLGVGLRFIQESKADSAAAKLKAMIKVTATVVREGKPAEVSLRCLVPGDLVKLSAGDMIPADVRIVTAKDLFIIQATLTGESLPVEKFDPRETRENISPLEFGNLCFLGTSVESGTAQALVVETGPRTYLGGIASSMSAQPIETSFDKGIKKFTYLMLTFMIVMVPMVFFINALSKSPSEIGAADIVATAFPGAQTRQSSQPGFRLLVRRTGPRRQGGSVSMADLSHEQRGPGRNSGWQSEHDRFRAVSLHEQPFPGHRIGAGSGGPPQASPRPRFPPQPPPARRRLSGRIEEKPQTRLGRRISIRPGRRGGPDPRNAAHDRLRLPLQGRPRHGT